MDTEFKRNNQLDIHEMQNRALHLVPRTTQELLQGATRHLHDSPPQLGHRFRTQVSPYSLHEAPRGEATSLRSMDSL